MRSGATTARGRQAALWIVTVGLLAAPSVSSAQIPQATNEGTPPLSMARLEVGLSAGIFVDFPEQFDSTSCDPRAVAYQADARYRVVSFFRIEGAATVTSGLDNGECFYSNAPREPIAIRRPYRVRKIPEGIEGSSFLATHIAAVVEPTYDFPVSPRIRIGMGRLWSKGLTHWIMGAGVRFRFGRHSMVMDVESWQLDVPVTDEVVAYQAGGGVDVLSSETFTLEERPFLVLVGWEWSVR